MHAAQRHALPPHWIQPARAGLVALMVALLVFVPYLSPNPYATGAYERYRLDAGENHRVLTAVLDWAVHAQPAIYKLGTPVRAVLEKALPVAEKKPPAESAVR
jgi:hypothetical protein